MISNFTLMKLNDLTGKRYGRLTVVEFLYSERIQNPDKNKSHTNTYWKCTCDCGNIIKTLTRYLNSGAVKSCGCLYNDSRIKQKPETAFNELYNSYVCRAKKRNIEFSLSKEKFREITKQNCFYCGEKPKQIQNSDREYPYIYNGIDRIDNTRGYCDDNIVPCCGICNKMKLEMSLNEFENKILTIAKNMNWIN